MENKKQTMYEILEVSPTASLEEIKAAHRRLSVKAMSGGAGLSREDCEFRLKVLDTALHTLSVPALRDAYDAELAPAAPAEPYAMTPARTQALALVDDVKVNEIASAVRASHQAETGRIATYSSPVQIVSSTIGTSARSLKTILRTIIGLSVLGFVLTVGKIAFASRGGVHPLTVEEARAEEQLIILEYYKKHGVRPASRAEAEFLEIENRRKENEQRSQEFAERRQQEEYNRFVEDSRRMGDRVHDNLVQEEAQEKWRQRQLEEEKRQQEEAAKEEERLRIENEKRRYGIYDSGTAQ